MNSAGCIYIHICVYVATKIKDEVMDLRVGVCVSGRGAQEKLDRKGGAGNDVIQCLCRKFSKNYNVYF